MHVGRIHLYFGRTGTLVVENMCLSIVTSKGVPAASFTADRAGKLVGKCTVLTCFSAVSCAAQEPGKRRQAHHGEVAGD